MQIVGGRNGNLSWPGNGNPDFGGVSAGDREEMDWVDLDADLVHWTKSLRPIQVYKSCRELNFFTFSCQIASVFLSIR